MKIESIMKTKHEIVTSMCYTYRHDYGLELEPNQLMFGGGMTKGEREALYRSMEQIFHHNILPLLQELGADIK